jgi:hypothetical protein
VKWELIKKFVCFWRNSLQWATTSSFLRYLDHTQRHTTVSRTPLDEWSARRRDLYLHNTQHSQQTDVHALGRIRTHNLIKRAAADPRRRPRGYRDRPLQRYVWLICFTALSLFVKVILENFDVFIELWQEFKNPLALQVWHMPSEPFANSHFYFLLIVEYAEMRQCLQFSRVWCRRIVVLRWHKWVTFNVLCTFNFEQSWNYFKTHLPTNEFKRGNIEYLL